ncbi:MAG: fibronectin type III domain-containing protein, partial [Planctomycetota bacterium]
MKRIVLVELLASNGEVMSCKRVNGKCQFKKPVIALFCLGVLISSASAKYGGGTGDANHPYIISTSAHMQAIGTDANDWDKHFKLTADIDLDGLAVPSIGTEAAPFSGVFDGNDCRLLNFETNSPGLFIKVAGAGSAVKNLGLIDPVINASGIYAAALVGMAYPGANISNCYVTNGFVSGAWTHCGSLAGVTLGSTVTNCWADGYVRGEHSGGLIGASQSSTITQCSFYGIVDGYNDYIGGLIGHTSLVVIGDCHSLGSVSSPGGGFWDGLGGLLGFDSGPPGSEIYNCYSACKVVGPRAAGLIGMGGGTVTNSFWDVNTCGCLYSGGGIGKTTAEMQDVNTFLDAGWDFLGESTNGTEDIWTICQAIDYPRLTSQFVVCEKRSDINRDGRADNNDLGLLARAWLTCPGQQDYNIRADLNLDSIINFADYCLFASDWTPSDDQAPTVPQNLHVTNETIDEVSLAWDASTDNVAVAGYNIYRDSSLIDSTTPVLYTDSNLAPDTIYTYTVSAYDYTGNESAQSDPVEGSTFDTEPPSVPQNLEITMTTQTMVGLVWDASTDNVGVDGYKVYRDGSYVISTPITFYVDSGLTPGTAYTYTVSAYDAADNESAQSSPVTTLPLGWARTDIGPVGAAGSADYNDTSDTFIVEGAGTDIGGTGDEFYFVYKMLSGNGQIIARVTSIEQTSESAKAGVMMRESLTADSVHAMALMMPAIDHGTALYRRKATSGPTDITYGSNVSPPYWVKLVRQGSDFSAYESSNGASWVLINTDTINNMPSNVYIGLAVSGATVTGDVLCTA